MFTIADMLKRPKPQARILTGLPVLDRVTRGGLPDDGIILCLGAPGSGKTAYACWQAYQWALQGVSVLYLAADQGPRGITDRWGQLAGYPRDSELEVFAEKLVGLPLYLDDESCLEDAGDSLLRLAGRKVLIVDSLQAVRLRAGRGDPTRDMLEKVDYCRQISRQGVSQVLLSEVQKGCTRPTLYSGKDSSSLEHAGDVVLGFRCSGMDAKIEILKNSRLGDGERETFGVSLSGARVTPVTLAAEVSAPSKAVASQRQKILETVGTVGKFRTVESIAKKVGGNNESFYSQWKELLEEGSIRKEGQVYVCAQ